MKILAAILIMIASAGASDFQQVKLLDVSAGQKAGPTLVTTNPSNGYSTAIPIAYDVFAVTVAIDGQQLTGSYYAGRHFKSSDLIVGDNVMAKAEGDNLILRDGRNKEHKGKIVRRARLEGNQQ